MGSVRCKMCNSDDSHACTPGANDTFYINKNNFKKVYYGRDSLAPSSGNRPFFFFWKEDAGDFKHQFSE